MRRLRSLIACLLLALWLPATLHCAFEAAGWVETTCPAHCMPGAIGAKDGCGTAENGGYKSSVGLLKLPAPGLLAVGNLLWSHLAPAKTIAVPAPLPRESFDRPRDWVSTWQFVRRAAPSPRAPSRSVA